MKPFKWMFEEQNATEIEYKGKQVSALYRYDKKGKYRLKFTFVSTNSQYEQSIILHLDGFKGKIFWNGKRLKKERRRFPQIIFEETWVRFYCNDIDWDDDFDDLIFDLEIEKVL